MRPSTALLTLCYLVPLVVASPLDVYQRNSISIPLSRMSRDTTIEDVKAHLTTVSYKYDVTSRNYALNTGSPHSLSNRGPPYKLGERSTGSLTGDGNSVPLKNQSVNLWYGSIAVGEPPESFTVQIDTGSADLFLCSVRSGLSCAGHREYNATSSATSLDLNTSFVVKYGNRTEVSGDEYTDVVELAGYKAINQTLAVTDTYYSDFAASNAPDGLAGFAFQEISSYGAAPLFQTLCDSHVLHKNVFGLSLSTQKDKSELRVGGSNPSMYEPDTLTIVPVTVKGYWQIQLDGLSRNGEDMMVPTDKAQAIVDTGTALIVTKPENAVKYYENIKGARAVDEIWTVPCDTIGLFAPTLTFGGQLFPVSSSTFNLGPVHEGSTDCIAGLTGMPGIGEHWIIGDVFLQNVYTIFDVGNTEVGFARLKL
ncbi:aspartic peptidase domain-containing protein [Suillus subaureus]|uniref:Aspartic peptidase domain-containing protein n=1 Tax=Suillus subaureus TaxID=48587 RepID=A0A9P7J6B7_9AGAM|nr:aspartic peptidase domain-containing protein [Suillus subaureus]KAG1805336.1 aspartic peptidase domain-containing protein [Suillus subaureus]